VLSASMGNHPKPYRLTHRHRLHGCMAFADVFSTRCRRHLGPITVYTNPNDLDHSRLGLSVPAKVGTAVKRNRIKRLLREAFRLTQTRWPKAYDVVVVVHPHQPVTLIDYQRLLTTAIHWAHHQWQQKCEPEPKT